MKDLLKNRVVQLLLALIAGIAIGAIFYPTKNIEREIKQVEREKYQQEKEKLQSEHSLTLKDLREDHQEEVSQLRSYEMESRQKIEQLTTENRRLKESSKKQRFKIVKPDGTIVEREYEETNREEVTEIVTEIRQEFDVKIKETEEKWKKVHAQRIVKIKEQHEKEIQERELVLKEKIKELELRETIEVNPKKLRLELGMTTDRDYHAHGSYTLWGPLNLGIGIQLSEEEFDDISFGLGIDL